MDACSQLKVMFFICVVLYIPITSNSYFIIKLKILNLVLGLCLCNRSRINQYKTGLLCRTEQAKFNTNTPHYLTSANEHLHCWKTSIKY